MADCHPYTDPVIQEFLNCYGRIHKLIEAAELIFSNNPQEPDLSPLSAALAPSNENHALATPVKIKADLRGINKWYYSIVLQHKVASLLDTPIALLGLSVAELEQRLGVQIFLE